MVLSDVRDGASERPDTFDSTQLKALLMNYSSYIWSKRWKQIWIDYWCIDTKLMLFHVIVLKFRNEFLGNICKPFYLHNVGENYFQCNEKWNLIYQELTEHEYIYIYNVTEPLDKI